MNDEPEVWAIVELMGHVRLAGRLTEEEKFGAKMGRLDIPKSESCPMLGIAAHTMAPDACPQCGGSGHVKGFVTQLFGGGSVYRITIVTEDVARHVAKSTTTAPVSPWDFPKQLENRTATVANDDYDPDEFNTEGDHTS